MVEKDKEREVVNALIKKMNARRAYEQRYGSQMPPLMFVDGAHCWAKINLRTVRVEPKKGADFWYFLGDFCRDFFEFSESEDETGFSPDQQHPAYQWWIAFRNHVDLQAATPRAVQSVAKGALGGMISWLRLAYDIFTFSDSMDFPQPLKERLMSIDMFQGARHELRVAALCISAGFQIEFEDEADNSSTHFEFVARSDDLEIAVEAKSRHRKGVQGFKKGVEIQDLSVVDLQKDLRNLVLDAYKKRTDLPFYVFVDANLPEPLNRRTWKRWTSGLSGLFQDFANEGMEDPSPANSVIFSNDGTHYYCHALVPHDYYGIWTLERSANNPQHPHPEGDIGKYLALTLSKRLVPPATFQRIEAPRS